MLGLSMHAMNVHSYSLSRASGIKYKCHIARLSPLLIAYICNVLNRLPIIE